MKVEIPNNFNLDEAIKFTCIIDKMKESTEYIYDYSNMYTVEPFGMLLISSKIRMFSKERDHCSHKSLGYLGYNNTYASHMGYFQSVNIDYGNKPGEASGSETYIPITRINIKDSYAEALFNKNMSIEEYIEKEIANKLVSIVSTDSKKLKKNLTFCITEILRNVYDHSDSRELWFAGQYWPKKDLVEIAILDEGKGITTTLKRNKKIIINNDVDALILSLKPGVTKSLDTKKNNSIYANQGFGLFMTSKICEMAGSFSICSGEACITIKDSNMIKKDCSFNGTAIRLRLKPSKLKNIELNDIKEIGEQQIKSIGKYGFEKVCN